MRRSYEAYGPGGTGFVIEALTDNLNRTAGAHEVWRMACSILPFTCMHLTALSAV